MEILQIGIRARNLDVAFLDMVVGDVTICHSQMKLIHLFPSSMLETCLYHLSYALNIHYQHTIHISYVEILE
jgi:hypothetical protein